MNTIFQCRWSVLLHLIILHGIPLLAGTLPLQQLLDKDLTVSKLDLSMQASLKWQEVLAQDSTSIPAMMHLATYHWEVGESAKCESLLRRALSIKPTDKLMLQLVPCLLHRRALNEAETILDQLLNHNSRSFEARSRKSHLLYLQGKFADAQSLCDEILSLRKDHPGALFVSGLIAEETGHYALAISRYRTIIIEDSRDWK